MTLLLAALLAWPWDVVYLNAESSQIEVALRAQGQPGAVPIRAAGHVYRSTRPGRWDRQCGSILSADYDRNEEEGDDGGPVSTTSGLFAPPALAAREFPAPAPKPMSMPAPIVLREHPCHRRC